MTITNLDDREVEILVLALRFWRGHRSDGRTRSSDPTVTPDAVDLLLAKLGASKMLAMSSRRPHKQSASWRIGDLADSSGEFGRSRPSR
jgi:hypothetical protein